MPVFVLTVLDSRLRGNDGGGAAGMTVEKRRMTVGQAAGRRKPGKGISENKEYKQKIILPLLLIDKTLLPMYKFPQYLRILAMSG